ncbi:FtsK/SpoIIIE domain-containing protein [Ligilactobacillus equi]|uniref:FtsK SpoIIIE family protein n=1 Tax=Ligilactobacillus equi DSM 15833 = JCM 10991 TaxID=1423740 RepID=A0A0R1TCY7_9LACO|nr:FtsK/SpoIIIE domain-containing protein [Ligilactobacillus equi]KRL79213.1 FtsK SpoIIIE family protein [Ligilactobacillus equi DSM 15833 = JCM 10991]
MLGYATPAFDYITSRLFVAKIKENINDSYFDALQERDEKGKKFEDGMGGTSATQTKKQVALAMRNTRSKVETVGGNRNNRHAKIVVLRSRETETDNSIQNMLKNFGSRVDEPFIQFQDTPVFNIKDNGFVFDSDVNYHAGAYLGSWEDIFINPFDPKNKKTNGGRGMLTTFFLAYANTLRYLIHLTPYSMYDRIRTNAKYKYKRDTSVEKAKFIARNNLDLSSVLPAPVDEKTGHTIEEATKEAIEIANSRINDVQNALNSNKIHATFDSVAVGGSQAIYKFTLPRDPDLPNDWKDVQKKMAGFLKVAGEPIISSSAGMLTVSIANQRVGATEPINIPVDFAEMVKKRDKGMKTLISGIAGVDALGEVIYVELGDANPHMAIFGQSGSGKTVTIMNILFSMMNSVTPEDVKVLFADGKGNSFEFMRSDGDAEHPNPFVMAQPADGSEDIEYTRALVRYVEMLVRKRIALLKERKVSKLAEFNKKFPDEKMEEILFVFDEFSAVTDRDNELKGDDYTKYNVTDRIEYITKMARSTGVRLMLANQTARKEKLPGKIMANVTGRISLSVSERIEAEIALPDSNIPADLIAQPGEFYSIMHGVNNPEHGNSPFLTDDQMYDLNDALTKLFGVHKYVATREEIIAMAEEDINDIGVDSGTYESPTEEEMPASDISMDDLVALCRKYPEWAIENEENEKITGLDVFNKGVPAMTIKNKKIFKITLNSLKGKVAQDEEKQEAEASKKQRHSGNALSTVNGTDGDFATLPEEKVKEKMLV